MKWIVQFYMLEICSLIYIFFLNSEYIMYDAQNITIYFHIYYVLWHKFNYLFIYCSVPSLYCCFEISLGEEIYLMQVKYLYGRLIIYMLKILMDMFCRHFFYIYIFAKKVVMSLAWHLWSLKVVYCMFFLSGSSLLQIYIGWRA